MLPHTDYITFKNILNENNIQLFDAQYRIAHYRYNKYIQKIPQQGGSSENNNQNLLSKIVNNKSNLLNHFVDSLLSNNINKTDYITGLFY